MTLAQRGGDKSLRRGVSRHTTTPSAPSAAASIPTDDAFTWDTVVKKSATDDAADHDAANDHPAAAGNDLVTIDDAGVDSADSDDNAVDKEDNASVMTIQLLTSARYWRAPGTTTRTRPTAAHRAFRFVVSKLITATGTYTY